MKETDKRPDLLFFRGQYEAALKVFSQRPAPELFPYFLGALVFTGRNEEANSQYLIRQTELDLEAHIASRFFLALGHVRVSNYGKAREFLAKNLQSLRLFPTTRSKFYIYQGVAFYRFFCGRWEAGLEMANRSFDASIEDDFLYGKILAYDLKGHLLAQVHNVDEGIKFLTEASKLAKRTKNTAIAEAADISILTYEALYGLKPKTIIKDLKSMLADLRESDTYSRATLLLEISRQLMLRGQTTEVRDYLDQASHLIFMYKNRRQEAALNLRWAYFYLITGEPYRALSFTQSAERCLDREVDHSLELATLGMQLKIATHLGFVEKKDEIIRQLQNKSRLYGNMIHHRMMGRIIPAETLPGRGDRTGMVWDQKNIEEIINTETFQLIYEINQWPRNTKSLILDFFSDSHLVLDNGQVYLFRGLTPLLRKIFVTLAENQGTKEKLIEKVWGHQYDPLRHDHLVYSTVTNLRKILGPFSHWVETTEQGYQLAAMVHLKSDVPQRSVTEKTASYATAELNSRQLTFLKKAKKGEFTHVRDYQKHFHVSEITACRDLAMLHREGYVVRVGRARATRYALPGDTL